MNLQQNSIVGGRYQIIEQIGIGGMAIVYRAKDLKLDRSVTLKVLKEEFIADEEFIKRFSVEARAAAQLNHVNIVNAYDVGDEGHIHYIVMEYIDGYTLKDLIKKKAPFTNEEALGVAIQIATGLEVAHRHNIVHRDIKPQNILVTKDGAIKVTDFGIARTASSSTVTAESIGSVHYFSPEQARCGYVDCKSDIYSLGIVMYEMVTGKVPFDGDNAIQLAYKHIEEPLPDMKEINPNISDSVEKIILKATAKISSQRYQSAEELNNDLKRALTNATGDFVKEANVDISQTMRVGPDEIAEIRRQTSNQKMPYDNAEAKNEEDIDLMPKKNDNYANNQNDDEYENDFDDDENYYDDDEDYDDEDYDDEDYDDDEDDVKKKKTKKQNKNVEYSAKTEKKVIVAAIVSAIAVIALITSIGAYFMNGKNDANYAAVPDFTGMSWEEATALAEKNEIYIAKEAEDYSEDIESGLIMAQSKEKDEKIKKGETIYVTTSKGSEKFLLPDVTNMELSDAYEKFSDAPINVIEEYVEDSDKELGVIVDQDPKGGTEITPSTEVKLYISKGKGDVKVTVPNVTGKSREEAENLLKSANLIVGNIVKSDSNTVEEDKVIKQGVTAGEQVNSGYIVSLVISTGKPTDKGVQEEETEAPTKKEVQTEAPTEAKQENTTSAQNKTANNNVNGGEMKTENLNISPSIDSGAESVDIKITRESGSSGEEVIFSGTRKATEFPFNLPVTGNTPTVYKVYVNGVSQGETTVQFN